MLQGRQVSRMLRSLAIVVLLNSVLPTKLPAQDLTPETPSPPSGTASANPPADGSNQLPAVTDTATRPQPRHKPPRIIVRPRQPAPVETTSTQVSGASDIGSGPAAALNLASQTTITGAQLNDRPVTRPGEILEAAPGLIVTQHSGEGKANQYFLRGYNLDHGTDMAIWVDDMPINMRTHAHGQGYSDLNFLMPETVNSLDVRKGPYFADEGDFGSAGNLHIGLLDSVDKTTAQFTLGSFGYERFFGMGSTKVGQGNLFVPASSAPTTVHGKIPTTCARSTASCATARARPTTA